MVKFKSVRVVLSVAAVDDVDIIQFDVKTAFIKSKLDEIIYIEQQEGYMKVGKEDLVCLLQQAIYGLKQSSRVWNQRFKTFLEKYELTLVAADPCVFLRSIEPKIITTIFVDDGLMCCRNRSVIKEMMNYLNGHLEIIFGDAEYYVGL